MYLIDNSTAVASQPPSTAQGTTGFFTDGNPATNLPATIFPAEFANAQMLEIANVITGAGIPLSKNTFNQLFTAIQNLIKGAGQGINSNAYINTSNKVNAVNAANVLFNSSGEFGMSGWTATVFAGQIDPFADGHIFTNNVALNALTSIATSQLVACPANIPLVMSAELWGAALTAGNVCCDIQCWDSTGTNSLGYIANVGAVPFGQPWTWKTGSGVTPANTAYISPRFYTQLATGPINSVGIRRIKVERGTVASLYSREADHGFTMPQFDNSSASATTAFVQRAVGSYRGAVGENANVTLTAANVGCVHNLVGPAGNSYVLPLAAAPLLAGATISFRNTSSGAAGIFRQGTDNISINGQPLTSITMGPGDDLTVTMVAPGTWLASGSAALYGAPGFASSFAAIGYAKLPSGLFLEWNGTFSTTTSGPVPWTFPVAFPHAIVMNVGSPNGAGASSGSVQFTAGGASNVSVTCVNGASALMAANVSLFVLGF
jgi:hypothetical protein